MDSLTVERFVASRDCQQALYAYRDTIVKALAYCSEHSGGKFAENCREVRRIVIETEKEARKDA